MLFSNNRNELQNEASLMMGEKGFSTKETEKISGEEKEINFQSLTSDQQ